MRDEVRKGDLFVYDFATKSVRKKVICRGCSPVICRSSEPLEVFPGWVLRLIALRVCSRKLYRYLFGYEAYTAILTNVDDARHQKLDHIPSLLQCEH